MRNKPGGLAWIKIPANYYGTGAEDLDGRYVITETLQSDRKHWMVKPPHLHFIALGAGCRVSGRFYGPGAKVVVAGLTDDMLIPVPDTGITDDEVSEIYGPAFDWQNKMTRA